MEINEPFSYRKLVVYQQARAFVKQIYQILENFPKKEEFGLCSQLRRAAVSIPSNIAEACGRYSKKEKLHFIEISFGSLNESICQLEIACDLAYIEKDTILSTEAIAVEIMRMLSGWRNKLQALVEQEKNQKSQLSSLKA